MPTDFLYFSIALVALTVTDAVQRLWVMLRVCGGTNGLGGELRVSVGGACPCRDPEPFDWYQRYSGLKDLVGQYLKKSDHIMMSGCGNSRTRERVLWAVLVAVSGFDFPAAFLCFAFDVIQRVPPSFVYCA